MGEEHELKDSAEAVQRNAYAVAGGSPKNSNDYHLPYWHYTEDTLLRLIALSAQALVKVDPFQEHPANKDLPEQPKEDARSTKRKDEISAISRSRALRSATALGGSKKQKPAAKKGLNESVILRNISGMEDLDRSVMLGRLTV